MHNEHQTFSSVNEHARRVWCTFVIVIMVALCCCHCNSGDDFAPDISPYEIMDRHYSKAFASQPQRAMQTMEYFGDIEVTGSDVEGSFHFWLTPPVCNLEYWRFNDVEQWDGDNGTATWTCFDGELMSRDDDWTAQRRTVDSLLWLRLDADSLSDWFNLTYLGIEEVNDHACYVIQRTNAVTSDTTVSFIDTVSLIGRKDVLKMKDWSSEVLHSDFREVDGNLMAFRQRWVDLGSDPKPTMVLHYQERLINRSIDSTIYDPPANCPPPWP